MSDDADRADEVTNAWLRDCLSHIPDGCSTGLSHCQDCGAPIPEARRIAYPTATRCVECQERAER